MYTSAKNKLGFIYYSWNDKTKLYERVGSPGSLKVDKIGDKYHITFVGEIRMDEGDVVRVIKSDATKGLQGTLTPYIASYGSNKVKLGDWVEVKGTGYTSQVVGLFSNTRKDPFIVLKEQDKYIISGKLYKKERPPMLFSPKDVKIIDKPAELEGIE